MPLLYALVSRNATTVLAENTFTGVSGNFSTVSRYLLKKIGGHDEKLSYIYDKYTFHYVVASGICYLVMADRDMSRSLAFQFLDDVKKRFQATYGESAKSAIAFAYNSEFQHVLQTYMEKFNSAKEDKLKKVNDELNSVKELMVNNLDAVLARGERIELLVDKSEGLDQHAFKFKKQSRALKTAMWWKNAKMLILIVVVVVILIYLILWASCGGASLPNCHK